MQDYADAAKWVASRWGSYLGGLEIWNEPNHVDSSGEAGFWKTSDQAGDYVRLLQAAYPAVKSAMPTLPVVGGSLVYSDGFFLQALYDKGIKGYFDAFAIHPYTAAASPYEVPKGGDDRPLLVHQGHPMVKGRDAWERRRTSHCG
jgi:hypothetical protein